MMSTVALRLRLCQCIISGHFRAKTATQKRHSEDQTYMTLKRNILKDTTASLPSQKQRSEIHEF
jgi:hypothetical protein